MPKYERVGFWGDVEIERRPTAKELAEHVVTPEQWAEALRYYRAHKDDLIVAAGFSRLKGVSHRNPPFKVGCTVMGLSPGLDKGEYEVWQAYNVTPTPKERKGSDKRCAERNAIEAAATSSKAIVAIVTISKEKSTGDPNKSHDALHPCQDCRQMLREHLQTGLIREDSIICNANDANEQVVIEERTLKDLLKLYHDDPK